ncbi:MAG: hypothetical protein LBR41_03290 [Rickettsiales bacterium]|jgi:hypothetical protein|nr:hypothetical protein [Rickettsiales bacterium]
MEKSLYGTPSINPSLPTRAKTSFSPGPGAEGSQSRAFFAGDAGEGSEFPCVHFLPPPDAQNSAVGPSAREGLALIFSMPD